MGLHGYSIKAERDLFQQPPWFLRHPVFPGHASSFPLRHSHSSPPPRQPPLLPPVSLSERVANAVNLFSRTSCPQTRTCRCGCSILLRILVRKSAIIMQGIRSFACGICSGTNAPSSRIGRFAVTFEIGKSNKQTLRSLKNSALHMSDSVCLLDVEALVQVCIFVL